MSTRPSPSAKGSLKERPLAHLLLFALERKLTGTMVFSEGEEEKALVYLHDGRPTRLFRPGGPMRLLEAELERLFELGPATAFAYYHGFDGVGDLPGEPTDPYPYLWRGLKKFPPRDQTEGTLTRVRKAQLRLGSDLRRFQFDADTAKALAPFEGRPFTVTEFASGSGLPEETANILLYVLLITKQVTAERSPSSQTKQEPVAAESVQADLPETDAQAIPTSDLPLAEELPSSQQIRVVTEEVVITDEMRASVEAAVGDASEVAEVPPPPAPEEVPVVGAAPPILEPKAPVAVPVSEPKVPVAPPASEPKLPPAAKAPPIPAHTKSDRKLPAVPQPLPPLAVAAAPPISEPKVPVAVPVSEPKVPVAPPAPEPKLPPAAKAPAPPPPKSDRKLATPPQKPPPPAKPAPPLAKAPVPVQAPAIPAAPRAPDLRAPAPAGPENPPSGMPGTSASVATPADAANSVGPAPAEHDSGRVKIRRPSPSVPVARMRLATALRQKAPIEEVAVLSPNDPRRSSTTLPASGPPDDVEARRREIIDRARKIDVLDHFEVLGVAREAGVDQINGAFFALAKRWHPDRLSGALQSLRDDCSKVFARISDAHATLTDPERRKQYLRLLAEGGASAKEQEKISKVLSAATNFQKAEVLMKRGDVAQAEQLARLAAEGDPEQADYIALISWIESTKPENQVSEKLLPIVKELTRAIQKNPKCERAIFYRGSIYKKLGQNEQAVRDFRDVADMNPRNVDAQREVRLYQMRREADGGKGVRAKTPSGVFGKLFKK